MVAHYCLAASLLASSATMLKGEQARRYTRMRVAL